MRKKLAFTLLSILLFICTVNAQLRESVIIETDIFTVEYSEILEQPLWVEYKVQCPNGDASRSGMYFYEVSEVHTSDDKDYLNNVWDKGHLAPVLAFNCDRKTLNKTFSYLNSALQHRSLNRGIWSSLERLERNLAKFYDVTVRVEVLFEGDCENLPTGATVPSGFRKTIKWDDQKEVFLFPNSDTKGTDLKDYHVK